MIIAFIVTIPRRAIAIASTSSSTTNKLMTIKGWDLFGRIPHDNWLFTNWRLTDPNLLKRSIHESVMTELPDVLDNFKRRKRISEISVLGTGLGYFVGAVAIVTILYKVGMEANLRRIARLVYM